MKFDGVKKFTKDQARFYLFIFFLFIYFGQLKNNSEVLKVKRISRVQFVNI